MRPQSEAPGCETWGEEVAGNDSTRVPPAVSGRVYINLSKSTPERDRYKVGSLFLAPAGVTVILNVGTRTDISATGLAMLREQAHRLSYEVRGGVEAVPRWLHALRTGEA